MSDEAKSKVSTAADQQQHPYYGTFQGAQPTTIGFPQPIAPPGASDSYVAPPPSHPPYYARGYQAVTGYVVAEGRPVRERRLPCCGIGLGWLMFFLGFFLAAIPWYIGAILLLFSRIDYREKPGYIACTVAAVLTTAVLILGVPRVANDW